jgi:membrane protease subunit HflK
MRWRLLGGLALLALLAYSLTGVAEVRPGERAVVRRFGRIVATPGPGLWVGLPAGMDRLDRVAVDRVQRVSIGYEPESDESGGVPSGQLLTGDHNLVNIQVLLDYTVDEERIEDFIVHSERVDGMLVRTAEAVLAEWVAGRKVDEVLIRGKADLPALLVHRTQARIAPYRLGVRIQGASIAHLYPPDEVRREFDEVTRAQASILTREHEARQEAAKRLREAEIEKNRIEKLAAAYATEQRVLARAEVDSFEKRLQQYRQFRRENPAYLAGLWWNEIGKILLQMKDNGRVDLLDNHLSGDGLDITVAPPLPKKK